MVANETAAVSALRTIANMNVSYSSTFQNDFAPSLAALGPGSNPPSPAAADLIGATLASGTRNGYVFLYTPVDTGSIGQYDGLYVNANPVTPNVTGQRYFYVDQTNVLRFALGGPANSSSLSVPR